MKHVKDLMSCTATLPSLSVAEFEMAVVSKSAEASSMLAVERKMAAQRRVNGLSQRAAIPARFVGADLEALVAEQVEGFATVRAYAERFDEVLRMGQGLLLIGDVGVGKTHLACALANALLAKMRPVMYCTALEAVMLVKRSWSSGGAPEFEVYEHFGIPDLLILDEVGVQRCSDFERMVLSTVIDVRSRKCLPTVAISNLDAAGVFEVLGERAFDRLLGFGGQVVEMRGRSLRRLSGV